MASFFAGLRSLPWRHNGYNGVSNHHPHDCSLNRSFRRRTKKTSKLRVTGLFVGNSPVIGEFPAQMASNAENISIWWLHHGCNYIRAIDVFHDTGCVGLLCEIWLSYEKPIIHGAMEDVLCVSDSMWSILGKWELFEIFCYGRVSILRLEQNGRQFLKWMLLNINIVLQLKFYWNSVRRNQLTMSGHLFRWWLSTEQVTGHYPKQCWKRSLAPYVITRPQWDTVSFALFNLDRR